MRRKFVFCCGQQLIGKVAVSIFHILSCFDPVLARQGTKSVLFYSGDMWALVEQYQKNIASKAAGRTRPSKTLFDFIYSVYSDYNCDTDEENDTQTSEMGMQSMESKEMGALAEWSCKQSPNYAAETP